MRHNPVLALIAGVTFACVENSAPGNDREAALDTPQHAAELATADAALDGVSTELLYPQIMTDADVGSIRDSGYRCVFRFTRVGFPVFVFSSAGGTIKLNGKLVRLPGSSESHFSDGAVNVTHAELDDGQEGGPFAAELVLRLRDAPNELGFHGFTECS